MDQIVINIHIYW